MRLRPSALSGTTFSIWAEAKGGGSFELSFWMGRDGKEPWRMGPKEGSAGNGVLGLVAGSTVGLIDLGLWVSGQPVLRRAPPLGLNARQLPVLKLFHLGICVK